MANTQSGLTDPQLQQHRNAIDARLRGLIDRVRRRFLIHGVGWMLAAAAAGILAYYVLDRALDLPAAVRIILSLVLAIYLAFGFRRRLLYPLSRKLARSDIAIAIERRFPDLRQRLISAVELADRVENHGARGESPAMIERIVDSAAADIAKLPTDRIIDPRRTRRIWAAALVVATISGLSVFSSGSVASTFFARMLGMSNAYPRETHLAVELPTENPDIQITLGDGTATVVMPAGGDLPVLVRVSGVVPREILLQTEGGRGLAPAISMTPRGGDRFRHVFRRVHNNFSFYARGGDDPYGDRTVTVQIVEPPRVATVRARLEYPAYTGRPPEEIIGGNIEAVVGTRAQLTVTATAAVSTAKLRLLDTEFELELSPITIQDDSGTGLAYTGTLSIERSDRYQIDFIGPNGIGNPHPGTYPIVAVEDHAPIAQLLRPSSEDLNVVLPNALLPIRIAAADDFGIRSIAATTIAGKSEIERSFDLLSAATAQPAAPAAEFSVGTLLEVKDLAADPPLAVGDSIFVSGVATDNREPEPSTTTLARRQIHVVGPTDLGRRISSHFRRIRESVDKAIGLQSDRQARLVEIRAELDGGAAPRSVGDRLITVEVGQGRVMSEARRFHRELMRSFDVHLFNRLEESLHAPKAIQFYEQYHRDNPSTEALDPAFYRAVREQRRSGKIGAMEKTLDPILEMIESADRLADDLCPRAVKEVETAGVTAEPARLIEVLDRAAATQATITQELESLRGRLAEWNEFQDVITQTRSIRDKQKDIRNRTRTFQRDTK